MSRLSPGQPGVCSRWCFVADIQLSSAIFLPNSLILAAFFVFDTEVRFTSSGLRTPLKSCIKGVEDP